MSCRLLSSGFGSLFLLGCLGLLSSSGLPALRELSEQLDFYLLTGAELDQGVGDLRVVLMLPHEYELPLVPSEKAKVALVALLIQLSQNQLASLLKEIKANLGFRLTHKGSGNT